MDFSCNIFCKQVELLEELSRENVLILTIDTNKKVEVNEASIAEWQKHECLWDVKARACKDRSARENAFKSLQIYLKL